jgi:hypothetical protein
MNAPIPNLTKRQIFNFWTNSALTANPDKCWEWQKVLSPQGYGKVYITSEYKGKDKAYVASRVSYFIANGEDPKELFVLHKCDNPKCVNPKHLFLGTQKSNINDMFEKKRENKAKGTKHAGAKITEEFVLSIRQEYKDWNGTQRAFAIKKGLSFSNMCEVLSGKAWKHI